MASDTSHRLADAFIVLLMSQEFPPLHAIQKFTLKVQNTVKCLISVATRIKYLTDNQECRISILTATITLEMKLKPVPQVML
ncbi:hypothetical protein RRG08_019598 [Elysia crispata]|uniref:Uncharacterized protein n=1 Tax=Elysia crispata TaxID=231223 RepID=A0AAE1AWJ5_9GAST|nr:hypothetical protein RRG08_019598 [Elysia crispata]